MAGRLTEAGKGGREGGRKKGVPDGERLGEKGGEGEKKGVLGGLVQLHAAGACCQCGWCGLRACGIVGSPA